MIKVLFICTHNSARSQMAEGLLRHLYNNRYEVYSAGTEPSSVNQYAVNVMSEIGIDISMHRSKSINEFREIEFDYIVTVCDNAKETCPIFYGGGKKVHKGFDDPSKLNGSKEEILLGFRRIRDEIKSWIEEMFGQNDI